MSETKYEIDKQDLTEEQIARLENNFTYHAPFGDKPHRYGYLRDKAKELGKDFCSLAPESRELSLALTNLEQAVMWVNAAIARNEPEEAKQEEAKTE